MQGNDFFDSYDYPDRDVATALLIREDSGEQDVRRSVLEKTSRQSPSIRWHPIGLRASDPW
jgi:hypothetical protein